MTSWVRDTLWAAGIVAVVVVVVDAFSDWAFDWGRVLAVVVGTALATVVKALVTYRLSTEPPDAADDG